MIKYLGSKRLLLPRITAAVQALASPGARVVDMFSGTSRVGHALKALGYQVTANDYSAYGACLARCYVEADRDRVADDARKLLAEFQALKGSPGYFTETFCVRSRFFQPKNGERVDAVREAIVSKGLDPVLESVVLTSLMEAADRVDSTCGMQMGYLKAWASRSHNDLELRLPALLPGSGRATQQDALQAVLGPCDVMYLDPPYNQHNYLGNYHVWESLVLWDKPEVYGVGCKRVDTRERKSPFNSKRTCLEALRTVVSRAQARHLVVSFSNEGYLSPEDVVGVLGERSDDVSVTGVEHERYVGAKIGIHNPRGEKVGTVSHTRNIEYLFVARDLREVTTSCRP